MPGDLKVGNAVRLVKRPFDMALVSPRRGKADQPGHRAAGDGWGGNLAVQRDHRTILDHAAKPGGGGGAVKIVAHVLFPGPGHLHRNAGHVMRHAGGIHRKVGFTAPPETTAHQGGVHRHLIGAQPDGGGTFVAHHNRGLDPGPQLQRGAGIQRGGIHRLHRRMRQKRHGIAGGDLGSAVDHRSGVAIIAQG